MVEPSALNVTRELKDELKLEKETERDYQCHRRLQSHGQQHSDNFAAVIFNLYHKNQLYQETGTPHSADSAAFVRSVPPFGATTIDTTSSLSAILTKQNALAVDECPNSILERVDNKSQITSTLNHVNTSRISESLSSNLDAPYTSTTTTTYKADSIDDSLTCNTNANFNCLSEKSISDTATSENNQIRHLLSNSIGQNANYHSNSVLARCKSTDDYNSNERKLASQKETETDSNFNIVAIENLKLSQQIQLERAGSTESSPHYSFRDQQKNNRLQQEVKDKQGSHLNYLDSAVPSPSSDSEQRLGFQLRALSNDASSPELDPWVKTQEIVENIHVPALSTELVSETLNYFVNCKQRLDQMTKTYDDNDAYILLLQEKEVDLELAARIGQDLLKQNKQLKEAIESLESELTKRQDDIQQLKHELASKTSLLDTFIEEEEQSAAAQDRADDEEERHSIRYLQEQQSHKQVSSSVNQLTNKRESRAPTPAHAEITEKDSSLHGFLALNSNSNHQRPTNTSIDPFSSLPYHVNENIHQDSQLERGSFVARDKSCQDDLCDDIDTSHMRANIATQRLVEDVTSQLVESNRRLCELQDELSFKSEQSILQQEKIFRLDEQLRDANRRLDESKSDNESLRKSLLQSADSQKELYAELKTCKNNFSELLRVFLELQRETRSDRTMHHNRTATYCGEPDKGAELTNISFDSFSVAPSYVCQPLSQHNDGLVDTNDFSTFTNSCKCNDVIIESTNHQRSGTRLDLDSGMFMSSSLQEELKGTLDDDFAFHHCLQNSEPGDIIAELCDDSDANNCDETDSGLHTTNISVSVTPTNAGLNIDTDVDSEDSSNLKEGSPNLVHKGESDRNWFGLSSFMLTTLLLFCLSASLSSSGRTSITPKLQIKLDR